MKMYIRSSPLAGALLTGALMLALVACAGQSGGTGSSMIGPSGTQVFNDVDVTFLQQMIMHHQKAIAMAKIAESRAKDPNVKQLASKIDAEQSPEIQTMTGWLRAWGKPAPTTTPRTMPSMMPGPNISATTGTQGAEFDRKFLQMMTAHHQAAVAMAKTEQASGANPEAKQLAKTIETSQTAEISQMQQVLTTLSPTHS
jgi:uncharacterized protein (DUF305 family)